MQKLDPTTWPKVEGMTAPSKGAYWIVCESGAVFAVWRDKDDRISYECSSHAIYGPIEFATNDAPETTKKEGQMKEIVFAHDDEVDTSKPCEGGTFVWVDDKGRVDGCTKLAGEQFCPGLRYFGPLKITLPAPLPPKPELVCVEYTRPDDARCGKIGWGVIVAGNAWITCDGEIFCCSHGHYKIISR